VDTADFLAKTLGVNTQQFFFGNNVILQFLHHDLMSLIRMRTSMQLVIAELLDCSPTAWVTHV
jgi:hypothetical protein